MPFTTNLPRPPSLIPILLLLTLVHAQRVPQCPSFCRFRFCTRILRKGNSIQPEDRVFVLRPPNAPMGPFPCVERKRGFLKALRNATAGEARVAMAHSGDPFVPISEYMASSIKPNFPKNYFRFIEFPQTGRMSLMRRRSRGNQEQALQNLCVQLPIKSFLKLRRTGSKRQRVFPKGRNACVAFRLKLASLDIDFRWDTPNDFDLRLVEPDGNVLSRFGSQDRSPSGGRLIKDLGFSCRIVFGQERIIYLQSNPVRPQLGRYTVIVDNTRACVSSSKYSLTVSYEGDVIANYEGTITASGDEVLTRRFTVP